MYGSPGVSCHDSVKLQIFIFVDDMQSIPISRGTVSISIITKQELVSYNPIKYQYS